MNIRRTISLVVCLFLCLESSQAQDQKSTIWDQAKKKSSELESRQKDESETKITGIPMEGPIDPAQYIVGPSDVIALIFWGVPPTEYTVAVTPEGTLLIPTVGEIPVADMTLTAAKKRVTEAVEKKYLRGSFTMTLIRPRVLLVSLQGAVARPGLYIASPTDRVEKIIVSGASDIRTPNTTFTIPALSPAGLPLTQEEIRVPKISTKFELDEQTSTRNIKVIRRTGDTLNVDIPKYYATLQNRYNPFLMDGDVIVVPDKNLAANSVSLSGAVNLPGRYEYVNGDSLIGFIRIGHGLLETADRRSATVFRTDPNAEHTTELNVDLQSILDGKQSDIPLERGDRILIRPQLDKRQHSVVTIGGEVLSPGIYPIAQEATRLSSIIRMAGGLTNRALVAGSVVWRKEEKYTIPDVQQLDYLTFLRAHQFDLVDSTYFFLTLKTGRQPVVVDFKRLLVEKDSTCDIILEPEDFIYIPSNDHSVLVQGQVARPGHVAHVPGANYKYYIRQAGDFQEYADEGDVRIIKAGTLSWFKPGDTSIEPGDRVWVPKETKSTFWTYFGVIRDLAAVGISIATLIYVSRK
jgi:protein involved in polysaccharide export with SLBB domain